MYAEEGTKYIVKQKRVILLRIFYCIVGERFLTDDM